MKCIRYSNGDVDRVSDSTADALVAQGAAVFVPKRVWKQGRALLTTKPAVKHKKEPKHV